ncbi:MAG: ABC transporter permease [Christensenellaceae bacterium]|jgi:simple sugar transport system permease protein|nr:ABC transporter permease [Christensenellaceae bacterium]
MKKKLKDFIRSAGVTGCLASLASIAAGLLVGLALLFAFNAPFALQGFRQILTTGVISLDKFAKVLYQSAPLIFTGLAVGFAFKTGLFNIGATGQYTVGAFCALVSVIQFQLPWYVGLVFAMVGGALWGMIPGLFKAQFNVNEVITSIMFNWIGLFVVNLAINNMPMMLANSWGAVNKDRTAALSAANPAGILPKAGLDKLMGSNYMHIGIFIAIIAAVIVWIILEKTTFGYELKACGYNRNASVYAGINAKRNIVLSMSISGAFAGIGGGIYYLSGTAQYTLVKALLAMGFNGIPAALLASSHPIGTIFSALFISYIQVGGDAMQPEFVKEIIDIIIGAIIYLSAFSLLMRSIISKLIKPNEGNVNEEAAASIPTTESEVPQA